MNKPIEKEGDADDFTIFLFSHKPFEKNSIKLELDEPEPGKHIGLHIFEQLLQIFVDGLKYLYGDGTLEGKVDISELTEENMETMKRYFSSIGFHVILDTYDQSNYVAKPDVFMNHELIKEDTMLNEFYYQILTEDENKVKIIHRISFKFLSD